MARHQIGGHQHPRLVISLESRTRLIGTFNVAVALRGKSCGWGSCERPRRTFLGHNRSGRREGLHFVQLVVSGRRPADDRVIFRFGDQSRFVKAKRQAGGDR